MYRRNSAFGFHLLSALVFGLSVGLGAPPARGWEEKPVVWEPLALPQVVEYIQDETLADEELVARLVKVLESRIAWYERWAQGDRHLPKGSARWSIGQDYARMAAIIGTSGRVGGHAPPARLKSIDLALVSARRASGGGPLPPILSLARALALPVGDDWYAELLALVRSNTLEPEVKLLAWQTLYPRVRLELLPLLLDLTKSPWSRSEANDTTGKFERVFPLRSVAVALLRALGVQVTADYVFDDASSPHHDRRTLMVEVDRKTVLELLRAAILSEDHGVWKAGLGAAVEMRSADVAELLDAIRDKLSAEKQSALKALLPRAAR